MNSVHAIRRDVFAADDAVCCCPSCGQQMPPYRLLRDIHGTPRLVDVAGVPCVECLRILDLSQDDHK